MKQYPLLGVSIKKEMIISIANTVGTDMSTYKIIKKNQFAYGPVTSRNGDKISIALSNEEKALLSQAYVVFETNNLLLPEYLMMWFRRPEFDRYARYKSHGSAREIFDWQEMSEVMLPIPSLEKQQEMVNEYHTIQNRINLNNQLIAKLEETAQTIYKQWFVDFEFPDENGKPYKSNGGKMVWCEELEKEIPEGWEVGKIGDYSKVKSGFAFKSDLWKLEGIPVIKIGSISNNTIDFNALDFVDSKVLVNARNYTIQKGDIVIAMTGATIGKIGIVPNLGKYTLVNQRVGMFNLGEKPLNKVPFLYLVLLDDIVQKEISNVGGDSAQANISNSQIENIKIVLPKEKNINDFNLLLESTFDLILNKIEENQKLEELKELLLGRMVRVEN
ncbi:restriction endonuclease subunit S [Cloacibacterium caeni]|uniref:restriction endonuclease subunit S n=1 Tax=Cloacibacterium caeni TaxID=2004710 RepID=UPI001BCFD5F5|nr:restriction endonuclease subunit S [Cloacibacterium caeni]